MLCWPFTASELANTMRLTPEEPRRLEAIVHADDVELGREMRRVLAAEQVGKIDYPRRLGPSVDGHHVVELRDVAARDGNLLAEIGEGVRRRIDVHAATSSPRAASSRTRRLPMNPVPPITSMVMFVSPEK